MDSLAFAEISTSLDDILFRRVDDVVRTKGFCVLLSLAAQLRDDDLVGAFRLEGEHDCNADGAAAEDEDGVAFLEGTDLHGVPADGEGLDEC